MKKTRRKVREEMSHRVQKGRLLNAKELQILEGAETPALFVQPNRRFLSALDLLQAMQRVSKTDY